MAGSRNFATKVWNAARFTLAQLEGERRGRRARRSATLSLADRWILSRFEATAADANRHLEAFRFDEAAGAIYAYVWHELCDGYLEMVKPALAGADTRDRAETAAARAAPLPRGLGRAAASVHAVSDRGDLGEAHRHARAR